MKIVELRAGDPMVDRAHDEILRVSFSPDELCPVDSLHSGLTTGGTSVHVVLTEDGRLTAVAVGEWSARSRVQLLAYLAVGPAHRGGGYGGRLLDHVVAEWRRQRRPCAILAEVHHPLTVDTHADHGDSAARVRFYAAHGASALDLPYFQPALAATLSRQYDMLLLALHLDDELTAGSPDRCASAPLREFITEYLESTEGGVADDPATSALFAAINRPHGVPTLPLTSPDLPRSRPS